MCLESGRGRLRSDNGKRSGEGFEAVFREAVVGGGNGQVVEQGRGDDEAVGRVFVVPGKLCGADQDGLRRIPNRSNHHRTNRP